jgi:vacuolar-type H+-ATPase subunit H
MGIMDKLKDEARDLAEKGKALAGEKGQELFQQAKEKVSEKASALKDQAAQKAGAFVDEQKQKLTDKLPDALKK